ncbi:MAG: S8 family serine peptidase [Spirochaetaceae bacterium]|nr:S8 family serine peptidase [Spirochaetaceae bacterium]
MTISVINATMLCRQEVQDKIRAVNRQLQDDFRRYWHADVHLRLEGWTGESPDPRRPLNMRGDAVIYLWDGDKTARALGYHGLTARGVPYGVVFPALSDLLNEDWSVTLSHEALELAMDPEINRLVQGPHPDPAEGGRVVYHWYELCDAVQADTYTIDGVAVSNFLLPLYFTENEEHLNHNDFLGRGVESFGVRPGGYVGFVDPNDGAPHTYHCRGDHRAACRLAAKAKFLNVTRTDRRGDGGDALNDPGWVSCESITFKLCPTRGDAGGAPPPLPEAECLVADHLGSEWHVTPCPGDQYTFDAISSDALPVSFAEAWDHAHVLGGQRGVVYAEPSFRFPIPGESDAPDGGVRGLWRDKQHKRGTESHTWAIEQCNVPEAWKLVEAANKRPGAGVLIGHPDSGFVEHGEMDMGRVRIDIDRDWIERDDDTRTCDDVTDGLHGLATASVIMSGRSDPEHGVSGPACYAEILPLRVTKPGHPRPAPVLFWSGMRRLRDAVRYAVKSGCEVISMSLGGVPYRSLREAIQEANAHGVIVCAAAGNEVGFVVPPARYDETIAVAGSDINRCRWRGSCRGPQVDVTAPAESVWRATVKDEMPTVCRGYGTSCAVALTAGIAAMWLSYHREELARRKPAEIPELFRCLVKKTASKRHNLPAGFGAGIIDAEALLRERIPKSGCFRSCPGPAEEADHPVFAHAAHHRNMPEALQHELICARSLEAMIAASQAAPVRGLKATSRNAGDVAGKLSDRLTRWLAEHGNSPDA